MTGTTYKKRVAVLFGGRSVEHEISILTGLEVLDQIDNELYEAVPVYIAQDGHWYTGPAIARRETYASSSNLQSALAASDEVTLLPVPGPTGLTVLTPPKRRPAILAGPPRWPRIPIDVFFLALHGTYGEDGCIQGLLELAGATYTGCDVFSSALNMNKRASKILARSAGLLALPDQLVRKAQAIADLSATIKAIRANPELGHGPLMIKPCSLGSSVGISMAENDAELEAAIVQALVYDDSILIEPRITDPMEINVSVRDGQAVSAAVIEVPLTSGVLTYAEKYLSEQTGKSKCEATSGMASMRRKCDPENVPAEMKQKAREDAVRLYRLLGCSGIVRVDMIVDRSIDTLYFNEINTLPGSLSYYTWRESNPSVLFPELIGTMITVALERKAVQLTLKRDYGFKALSKAVN